MSEHYTPEQMRGEAGAAERHRCECVDGGCYWCDRVRARRAMLRQAATDAEALATLRQLVVDLQQHSREAGWQDVDDPIAALLALSLTGDATEGQG